MENFRAGAQPFGKRLAPTGITMISWKSIGCRQARR
jgi:hypothetical protein